MPRKYPTIAICYDFDGTLSPNYMHDFSFFPAIGITNKTGQKRFWIETKKYAEEHDMNEILAYMYLMLKKAKEKDIPIRKKDFINHGKTIKFFLGVEDYFPLINAYARTRHLKIQHYIISSGLREIISGSRIAKYFEYIYASGFMYDPNEIAIWPALAIDYTAKTQYLFRINKGIPNSWDNSTINKYVPDSERPIPFDRMIYIGDGETDVPAMKMVTYQGGKAIAVYNPNKKRSKAKTKALIEQKRANYFAAADYSENSDLVKIIKLNIDQISNNIELEKYTK